MRKVLIVDDDPIILRSLKRLLCNQYEVLVAENAEEALALIASHKIDAVVSDHNLPEVTGMALLKQVGAMSPSTLRVLMSGVVTSPVELGPSALVNTFLEKPVRYGDLIAALKFSK
jgi:response regulator RpfG family c-di-GMP phosphodiesterase